MVPDRDELTVVKRKTFIILQKWGGGEGRCVPLRN